MVAPAFALALAVAPGRATPAAPPTLVVLAGQSNALGYGVEPKDLPAAWKEDPSVRIWRNGRFETLSPGRNTGTPRNPRAWGPEVGFALAWRRSHPQGELDIVKVAKGSTGLAADPRALDWSPRSRELYADTTAQAAAAQRASGAPVAAILWMQGEEDAVSGAKAAAYGANLTAFVRAARRDWGDAPVVLGRIGAAAREAHAAQVRRAQAEVARTEPRIRMVDTDAFPVQSDRLHLDARGQLALGDAMARALEPAP